MVQATPFAALIEAVHPGATGRHLVELLDRKAHRTTALDWRSGRRNPPQWAIDTLRAKLMARHERELAIIDGAKAGPTKRAGARNLATYLARR